MIATILSRKTWEPCVKFTAVSSLPSGRMSDLVIDTETELESYQKYEHITKR